MTTYKTTENKLLTQFSNWLSKNYDSNWSLTKLIKRNVGIHNGRLHRSLSQIQVKLFEGKYDDSDVRMTVNGHFLGLIVLFVLSLFNIQLSFVFSLLTSIVLIVFSILFHKTLNKK